MTEFVRAVDFVREVLSLFRDEKGNLFFNEKEPLAEAIYKIFEVKLVGGECHSKDMSILYEISKIDWVVYEVTLAIAATKLRMNQELDSDLRTFLADVATGTFPVPKKVQKSKVLGRNQFICLTVPVLQMRFGLKPSTSSTRREESGCHAIAKAMNMSYDNVVKVWGERDNYVIALD